MPCRGPLSLPVFSNSSSSALARLNAAAKFTVEEEEATIVRLGELPLLLLRQGQATHAPSVRQLVFSCARMAWPIKTSTTTVLVHVRDSMPCTMSAMSLDKIVWRTSSCLDTLLRASSINASRAARRSLTSASFFDDEKGQTIVIAGRQSSVENVSRDVYDGDGTQS